MKGPAIVTRAWDVRKSRGLLLSSLPAEESDMTERYGRVLAPRAVLPEFVSGDWGQRYAEFEQGDWEAFEALHSHPERFHKKVVRQTGGYIVNRWNVTRQRLVPYVRPDEAVTLDGRKKPTKYIQPSKTYPGQAKRLDVHPRVLEALRNNTDEPIRLAKPDQACSRKPCLSLTAIAIPAMP